MPCVQQHRHPAHSGAREQLKQRLQVGLVQGSVLTGGSGGKLAAKSPVGSRPTL